MDTKNVAILLLLLLCVLGLAVGVYFSEVSPDSESPDDYESTVEVDPNGTITIHLEKKDNESSFLDKYFK
jgi:hypothetical protein